MRFLILDTTPWSEDHSLDVPQLVARTRLPNLPELFDTGESSSRLKIYIRTRSLALQCSMSSANSIIDDDKQIALESASSTRSTATEELSSDIWRPCSPHLANQSLANFD